MLKKYFFQTGLPYLLFAVFIMLGLIFTETLLKSSVKESPIIKITPSSDEAAETLQEITPRLDASHPLVTLLIKRLTSNQLTSVNDVLNAEPFLSLSPSEHLAIVSSGAYILSKKQDFVNTINLLTTLTVEQRVTQDVQFTFAHALSKTDKTAASIEQYKLYKAFKPNAFAAIFNHGLLLKKTGAYEEAIRVFLDAADKSSGYKKAKALRSLADSEYQLSRYTDAINHYKKSIEYRPNNPNTWAQLGKTLSTSGAPYKQVADAYEKATALNQQDPRLQLAKAKYQLQHYDYTAVFHTLKGTQSKSNNINGHRLLAWSFLELGKRNNAKKHIRYLIQHETSKQGKKKAELMLLYANKHYKELLSQAKNSQLKSDDFYYLKALAYRKLGFYKSSMPILNRLLDSETHHWRSRIQIARIKRSRHQYNEAVADYQQLILHNNAIAFLPFELSLTYESLAQAKPALESIRHALSINAANKAYQLANIRLLQLSGASDAALLGINTLLAENPTYARAIKLKAQLQIARNEPDNATKTLEQVLALQPSDIATLKKLSELLIDRSRYKLAQSYLTTLLTEQSDSVDARYLLAYSYFKDKKIAQALTELDNVLKLNHQHQLAKELKRTINSNFIS